MQLTSTLSLYMEDIYSMKTFPATIAALVLYNLTDILFLLLIKVKLFMEIDKVNYPTFHHKFFGVKSKSKQLDYSYVGYNSCFVGSMKRSPFNQAAAKNVILIKSPLSSLHSP